MKGQVLVVDDDREVRRFLEDALGKSGFAVTSCASAREALDWLRSRDADVVVTDLRMPHVSGLDLARDLAAERPDVPVVVMTAFGSLETAVQAMRAGAHDFITKPFDVDLLVLTLERTVAHRRLREEVRRLRSEAHTSEGLDALLGTSPAMRAVYDLVQRVADSDSSVLVTGESGTGKELVARALHQRSRRREGVFLAVNCAALPETLLESELFGHARGAFTDAREARPGLFLSADGGTLFLDEIGDFPLPLQPKLLRVLQERRIRPVGEDREVPVDVRIVAATNKDLEALVAARQFREDLYYRLNVIPLALPPLRVRGQDILLLAHRFLTDQAARAGRSLRGFSSGVAEKLLAYDWPGNVRELENCMERAVTLARFDEIGLADLPDKIREHRPTRLVLGGEDLAELITLEEMERRYVARVLEATGGNKSMAARILGVDRTTLWRRFERGAAKTA